jgi:hypothetical protein
MAAIVHARARRAPAKLQRRCPGSDDPEYQQIRAPVGDESASSRAVVGSGLGVNRASVLGQRRSPETLSNPASLEDTKPLACPLSRQAVAARAIATNRSDEPAYIDSVSLSPRNPGRTKEPT